MAVIFHANNEKEIQSRNEQGNYRKGEILNVESQTVELNPLTHG